jgi:hypothetical protein
VLDFLSVPKSWTGSTIPLVGNNQVRVLTEVVIYLCIDNPYGLNKYLRVEKDLEFNSIKGLGERHCFTQFNGGD